MVLPYCLCNRAQGSRFASPGPLDAGAPPVLCRTGIMHPARAGRVPQMG